MRFPCTSIRRYGFGEVHSEKMRDCAAGAASIKRIARPLSEAGTCPAAGKAYRLHAQGIITATASGHVNKALAGLHTPQDDRPAFASVVVCRSFMALDGCMAILPCAMMNQVRNLLCRRDARCECDFARPYRAAAARADRMCRSRSVR